MTSATLNPKQLSVTLIDEIINAAGLPKIAFWRNILRIPFSRAADRLSSICLTGDQIIASDGAPASAAWMASHWVSQTFQRGSELVPPAGSLLAVTNHCGVYDFLVLATLLNRQDIKIICSDVPFLKALPNISKHLIFLSDATADRMHAFREGVAHLKSGGALLLFGTGSIDPDPAVFSGASQAIENWSPSIEMFMRQAPQTQMVLGVTSGFLSQRWAHAWITHLRRIDWQQRRIAEFGQVIQQLFKPGSLFVQPSVSFAPPVTLTALLSESPTGRILPTVIQRGKALLDQHLTWIKP